MIGIYIRNFSLFHYLLKRFELVDLSKNYNDIGLSSVGEVFVGYNGIVIFFQFYRIESWTTSSCEPSVLFHRSARVQYVK